MKLLSDENLRIKKIYCISFLSIISRKYIIIGVLKKMQFKKFYGTPIAQNNLNSF